MVGSTMVEHLEGKLLGFTLQTLMKSEYSSGALLQQGRTDLPAPSIACCYSIASQIEHS